MSLNRRRHHANDRGISDLPMSEEEFPALNGTANDNLAHGTVTPHQSCCLEAKKAIPAQSAQPITFFQGDCLEVMRTLPDNSVDSIVSDPPYGLAFMGKKWDYSVPSAEIWMEALRVLKPGGYLLAFGGTRTYHRLVVNVEDAGFEIRDQIVWVHASGFPKSHDVAKAIDKTLGAEREVIGKRPRLGFNKLQADHGVQTVNVTEFAQTSNEPASDEAAQWQGWGTALKPAMEPVVVARKPLIGTVAANVLEHGTGALNIDGCRVPCNDKTPFPVGAKSIDGHGVSHGKTRIATDDKNKSGRWPTNFIHDGSDEVVANFPYTGATKAGSRGAYKHFGGPNNAEGIDIPRGHDDPGGSAARFFYQAKATKADRAGSKHPTVKPIALMRHLCRLVTPPGGTVLDPFGGSGTTGQAAIEEGFKAILIEREAEYAADIRKRFNLAANEIDNADDRIAPDEKQDEIVAHDQAPEPPPVPVAANDDAPAVGPDEQDEIVARVQAIMAAPKRRKAAKAPAWKVRLEARRQDRKVARRVARQAGRTEQRGLEELAVQSVAVPAAPVLDPVAPVVPEYREPANENAVATSVTLHQGDCLEVLRTLKDIDLAVTSPPYCNVGMEYGDSFENIDAYVEFSGQWIKATADALKPTGACWINVGMLKGSGSARIPLTYYLFPVLEECGLTFVQEIIWDRRAQPATLTRFGTTSERWLFCVKNPKDYTFNLDAVRRPHRQNDKRNHPLGANPGDIWDFCQVHGVSKERNAHPCQFPQAMIERIVLACSNPGDAVLDPFGGSGTTGAAAIKHGRNAVLIERDAGYCDIIGARLGMANCQVVAAENDNSPAASLDRERLTVPSDRAVAVLPMLAAAKPRVADAEEGDVAIPAPASTPPERHLTVNENGSTTSVTFYQGDCLQTMRGMADGSVDVVVTSPPYNLGTSTGNGFRYGKSGGKWKNAALQNGYASYSDDMPDEAYVEWLKAVISECWRLIPDDGAIFFNHKPRVQGGVCLLPTRFLPPEVILRQEIIWARSGGMNFNQSFFLPTHERVLVLAKPKFRLKKGASGIGDVWTIPHERKNEHPAPFPLELPRRCIAATNAKVIFDPFTGSGTTGVAAQLEGRDFIGCELDPGYLEMARQRLGVVAAQPQPPTLEVVSESQTTPPFVAANDHDVVRYATVCSGIEGVSAAVEPLGGFKAEFFSDKAKYSPFAAEFLKWKFPHVPYIDDFTTIDGSAYRGKVDVLWGSTPCQTWSKAGKNAGLADDRGQLTLNFINLVNEIQPQLTIWENVKNVLSHKEAFGQFLGTLAGEDCKLLPAGKKWENAGYVRGPDRQIAWRVFDAEYAGLAARRERVFLVATPVGGADPRDILWERDYPEAGGRHPEAGRGAWERIEGEKVRLCSAGGGAGGPDGPFAFNADTSPKSSEIGLTLRADTASGGFQGIALRDENGPRAFRLTPEMMERMLGFPPGWTDMGDAWTGRGRLDIRRRAALGNSLAVPDVRWILERVKASVQGALGLHHWPEPEAANDNSDDESTRKAAA